jgi:hypothetical protein
MPVPRVIVVAMVAVAAVSAPFRLECGLHVYQIRFETMQHIFDYVVGADAQNLMSNFSRQMTISQMPGDTHELIGIFMPDLDERLRGSPDLQQSPVVELQGIPIGHRNRFRKVEQDIFALVRGQANAAAMARLEIEGERASGLFLGPVSGGTVN